MREGSGTRDVNLWHRSRASDPFAAVLAAELRSHRMSAYGLDSSRERGGGEWLQSSMDATPIDLRRSAASSARRRGVGVELVPPSSAEIGEMSDPAQVFAQRATQRFGRPAQRQLGGQPGGRSCGEQVEELRDLAFDLPRSSPARPTSRRGRALVALRRGSHDRHVPRAERPEHRQHGGSGQRAREDRHLTPPPGGRGSRRTLRPRAQARGARTPDRQASRVRPRCLVATSTRGRRRSRSAARRGSTLRGVPGR